MPQEERDAVGHRDDTLVRILYGNHLLDDTQQAMAESAYRALFGRDGSTETDAPQDDASL